MNRRIVAAAAAALPVLFLGVFLLYPVARILALGLAPMFGRGASGARELERLLADTGAVHLLLASAGQALLSTLLTLAVGIPAAYVFARFDFPAKAVLRSLLAIPFVLPTVVVGSAFVALIGAGGLADRLAGVNLVRTLPAVLLAHAFYNVSIVVRIVGGSWANLDPRLEETARMLGAGRARSFLRVTLRLLLPSLAASALLVFAFCFTSFGVILVLGGPRIGTIETEIYRQAVHSLNLPAAAMLSALQLVAAGLVMLAYSRLSARAGVVLRLAPGSVTSRAPRSLGEWALVAVCGLGPTIGLMLPLAVLAAGSVTTPSGISLQYWISLFRNVRNSIFWVSPAAAAMNSLAFSGLTVALSLALGIPAAYLVARTRKGSPLTGAADLLFLLPLGTSAVTLGFGFIVSLGTPPLDLRGSVFLIPIAHALIALPLVVRSLVGPLRSIEPGLRESAALLGASPARVRLSVDLPVLRRAFLSAAAFAFTVSLGEFAATALLTRPELATIPVVIYGFLTQPGDLNRGQAMAMSVILMAACALGVAAIERFRPAGTSEVF
ncbi:MAG: iron ABC transporter permease [Spirochaetes bacterium]|nr:iron ABC transporter permease [Spirochaetota bacterium]